MIPTQRTGPTEDRVRRGPSQRVESVVGRAIGAFEAGEGPVVAWMPAPMVELETFLGSLDTDEAVMWAPGASAGWAGLGCAARIDVDGGQRFRDAAERGSALIRGLHVIASEGLFAPAPRLLGGLAFCEQRTDEPWTPFGAGSFVLPRWTYVRGQKNARLGLALSREPDEVWGELERITCALEARVLPGPRLGRLRRLDGLQERARWCASAAAAVRAIVDGRLGKVVLSRSVPLVGDLPIDARSVAWGLRGGSQGATRFLFRRDGAAFLGATPETLVQKEGVRFFTEALAGSRATEPHADPVWADKECAEHRWVLDHIVERATPLAESLVVPATPEVHRLRDVMHLRTPITGVLREGNHILELAEALHPTPAVGGTPVEAALRFIAAREPHDRGWYAGPVGWFDGRGDGELRVALRAGLVHDRRVDLFAGAGIVIGSEPERELEETELKLRPMLRALGVGF